MCITMNTNECDAHVFPFWKKDLFTLHPSRGFQAMQNHGKFLTFKLLVFHKFVQALSLHD